MNAGCKGERYKRASMGDRHNTKSNITQSFLKNISNQSNYLLCCLQYSSDVYKVYKLHQYGKSSKLPESRFRGHEKALVP